MSLLFLIPHSITLSHTYFTWGHPEPFFFFYKKFLIALTTLLTTRLLLVLNGDGGSFAKFLFFFAEKLFLGSLFPTKLKSNSVPQNCLIFIYFVSMFSTHFQFLIKFFVPDKFNLRENRKVSSDSGQLLIYKSGCKLVLKFEHINLGQGTSGYFLRITNKAIIAIFNENPKLCERTSFVGNLGRTDYGRLMKPCFIEIQNFWA